MLPDEPVVLPPFLTRVLWALVAITLASMVAIVVMDQQSPTVSTPWGEISESTEKVVIGPSEAPLN